jgi:hypothetical protein
MKSLVLILICFLCISNASVSKHISSEWFILETEEHVYSDQQEVKLIYCPGPDIIMCAVEVGGSGVTFRP